MRRSKPLRTRRLSCATPPCLPERCARTRRSSSAARHGSSRWQPGRTTLTPAQTTCSASAPSSSLKGSGAAEKTMASTISASFTMPITRLISISLLVKALPRRKLATSAESAERFFKQHQHRRDGKGPAHQRPEREESQRKKDRPDREADQVRLAAGGDVRRRGPLNRAEPAARRRARARPATLPAERSWLIGRKREPRFDAFEQRSCGPDPGDHNPRKRAAGNKPDRAHGYDGGSYRAQTSAKLTDGDPGILRVEIAEPCRIGRQRQRGCACDLPPADPEKRHTEEPAPRNLQSDERTAAGRPSPSDRRASAFPAPAAAWQALRFTSPPGSPACAGPR